MPKSYLWKAQWPLAGSAQILIYREPNRDNEHYLTATPENRKALFNDEYIRIYFIGWIHKGECHVDKFVKRKDWL